MAGLESIVNREDSALKKTKRDFDVGHWVGSATGYLGSLVGAYATNVITGRPYLAATIGGIAGDFAGYTAGFTPYWYLKNSHRYKGIKGKFSFLKDMTSFYVKAIPLDIGFYALDIPLSVAGTFLTGNPVLGTGLAGIISNIAYWLGYRKLSERRLKKISKEKNSTVGKPYEKAA